MEKGAAMAKKQKKKKKAKPEAAPVKDFLDMIAPAAVKFNTDSSVLGSSCRCTLALRSYPAILEKKAACSFTFTSARSQPPRRTPSSTTPRIRTGWTGAARTT